MKKILAILSIIIFMQIGLFAADVEYLLGTVESRMGKVNVIYVKEKRTNIRIEIAADKKVYVVIYLDQDMKNFKAHVEKFNKWHKTAVENDYDLNKKIGELSTFIIDFITTNKKYEISFSSMSGMRLITFSQDSINELMKIISDENIDLVINEEKRKKQREDELFQ